MCQTAAHDIKIIIGDMNAKIGKEEIQEEHIGRHRLYYESHDSGNRVINFVASKNTVVGSTTFE